MKTTNDTNKAKLTPKEERFCYEYVLHLNATKAAINAGYSEKTARSIGYENLTKLHIQNKICQLKTNLAETSEISALRVLKEHEKIAFASIAHLHNTWIERKDFENLTDDQKACIKNISTKVIRKVAKEFENGEFVDVPYNIEYLKIELYDKQKSLESISNMLGFDAPVRTELTGKDGAPLMPMTKEEILSELAKIDKAIKV